jgi:HEAT repeats
MTALREPQCDEIAPILVFYVWDEVTQTERDRVETHLAICGDCKQQLADERLFAELIANNPQAADELDTSGILLAQCRSQLSEGLDDMAGRSGRESWRPFGWLSHWMAVRPAWSGALLLLVGVLLGTQILPLLHRTRDNDGSLAVDVKAAPALTDDQLARMAVAAIRFSPEGSSDSGASTVNLQLQAEQPMVVSGNVQDRDVKRVLMYVVRNGERFNPGVRLDCLDALKAAAHDQEVRHALLTAAQHDSNPAVRMKALEALGRSPIDDPSREALLNVLEHDANPGVRVVAVNLLVRSLGQDGEDANAVTGGIVSPQVTPLSDASMEHLMRTLQELQRSDPSQYVRLRSAAALRQISSAEVQ